MKFFTIFVFSLLFFSAKAQPETKQYLIGFDKSVQNVSNYKAVIEKCNGVVGVIYCSDAKAFKLTLNPELYTKLENLEIYVRPNLEKITTNKFYFAELSSPNFSNLNCN